MNKFKAFFVTLWWHIETTFWRIVWWGKHRAGFLDLKKDITVVGEVVWTDFGKNPDGDFTLNLKLDKEFEWAITSFGGRMTSENENEYPATIHCEVTPWDRPRLDPDLQKIKIGSRVKISGRWGFDGVHTGKSEFVEILYAIWGHGPSITDGWCEIHPITKIEIL